MDWLGDDKGSAVFAGVKFEVEDGARRKVTIDLVRKLDHVGDASSPMHGAAIADLYRQAEEEIATHKVTSTPLKKDRQVTLRLGCEQAGDLAGYAFEGSGKVKSVGLVLRTKARAQVARVVLSGVDVASAVALVGMLERTVQVEVRQIQPSLALGSKREDDRPVAEVGRLVTAQGPNGVVCGLVSDVAGEAVRVDDFGVITTVRASEIATVYEVIPGDAEEVVVHLQAYRAQAEETERAPSWAILVEALSEAWGTGTVERPTAGQIAISGAVVDLALARHVAAGSLPPEAGTDGHDPEDGDGAGGNLDDDDADPVLADMGTDGKGRSVRRRRGA